MNTFSEVTVDSIDSYYLITCDTYFEEICLKRIK